jgi:hypothetical protein
MTVAEPDKPQQFARLRRAKENTLKELLRRKPGGKHYPRALRAYLEADHALQSAIIERLGLDFHE